MARSDPEFRIRLPQDLKDKIVAEAERQMRSINSEIVLLLAEAMDRRQKEKR